MRWGHRGPHLYPKELLPLSPPAVEIHSSFPPPHATYGPSPATHFNLTDRKGETLRVPISEIAGRAWAPIAPREEPKAPPPQVVRVIPSVLPAAVMEAVASGEVASMALDVTPEIAQTWLECNTDNRRLRQSAVSRYSRLMKAGKWELTHAGIAFSDDGTLLDGQHRLWAVFDAGVTVRMMVTWNLPRAARMAMDVGMLRATADAITLDAGRGVWNRNQVATLRATIRGNTRNQVNMTAVEAPEYIDKYGEMVQFAHDHLLQKHGLPAELRAAVARASVHVERARLIRFCEILGSGLAETPEDHIAILLREWLREQGANASKQSEHSQMLYQKSTRAIQLFMRRAVMQKLQKAREEKFEDIYPLPA
jgi:hypothetical protein